jgi:hypothetical protein
MITQRKEFLTEICNVYESLNMKVKNSFLTIETKEEHDNLDFCVSKCHSLPACVQSTKSEEDAGSNGSTRFSGDSNSASASFTTQLSNDNCERQSNASCEHPSSMDGDSLRDTRGSRKAETLVEIEPSWSSGSETHTCAECSACAFYYSEEGCNHGSECKFCHLCPPGAFYRQKKIKRRRVLREKRSQRKINSAPTY